MTIQIQNEKHVFPSFSISLTPYPETPLRFSTVYTLVIPGTRYVSKTAQAVLRRRGAYVLHDIRASSRYPFGFFVKNQKHSLDADCICYPEILPVEQLDFTSDDHRGTNQRFERGLGHDLYMIRDYQPSDSARHVHWKASAKTSVLKTREYAAEQSSRAILVFDRFGNADDAERFEQMVSRAASLVQHLINSGADVKFVTEDWDSSTLEDILEYLALVEMSTSAALPWSEEAAMTFSLRH